MDILAGRKPQKPTFCGNKVDIWPNNQILVSFENEVESLENGDVTSVSRKWHQKIGDFICSVFRATSSLSLDDAEAEYEAKRFRQEKELKEVIEKKVDQTPWFFSVYSLFGFILGLAVVSFSFVFWERENVYTNQDTW